MADLVQELLRPEFVPAFDEWLNLRSDGFMPPGTAYSLPEYHLASEVESDQLLNQSLSTAATAREANQDGVNFILTTVLFSSVLFLAGIQTKVGHIRLRLLLIIVAAGIFVVAFGLVLVLPFNLGL